MKSLEKYVEGTPDWYREAWRICQTDPGFEDAVAKDAKIILHNKDAYQKVEDKTGVPWYVVGAIHFKECGCHPLGCLVNGQKIIGTGRKTTIVPIGRGPYASFYESAIDGIKLLRLDRVKDWEIGNLLFLCERYNGSGYIKGAGRAETTPYLWARTNINDGYGKYVSDGKFDPNAPTNKTSGICAVLKWLESMGHIVLGVRSSTLPKGLP